MIGLPLTPPNRNENSRFSNACANPGHCLDAPTWRLDANPVAIRDAKPPGSIRVNLAVKIGPHLLRLPEVMRSTMEMGSGGASRYKLAIKPCLAQHRAGAILSRRHDSAARSPGGCGLVER